MLFRLAVDGRGQFIQDGLHAPGQIGALLVEQPQPWQQEQGMFAGGFCGSWGQRQGLGFQDGPYLAGIDTADAVEAQDALDFGFAEPGGANRRWRALKQSPQPWLVGRFCQLDQLREEAMELLAQPVGGTVELLAELVFQARQLP